MELPQRSREDVFLPAGSYRSWEQSLRSHTRLAEVRCLVVSAFDRSTRMHPFIYYDWYLVPCGPRSIAGAMRQAGLSKTRFVFQLWNPNIRPSQAQIEGAPLDMLLISSLQIHSASSYWLIEDAWKMGPHRPLIVAGGPKACYEPFDYFGLGPDGQIGADVVITGEEPVLLNLLTVLADFGGGQGTMLTAFHQARTAGALKKIPGLVYALDGHHDGQNLFNTGIQRLLCDLDELPMPASGFAVLEGPHRQTTLATNPIPLDQACRGRMVATILVTRGCKFHCHYCPIPAYNQRTIRRKSPQRVAEEFLDCRRQMNTRYFFGTDDNFFSDRKTALEIFEALDSAEYAGIPLGRQTRFLTESTVIDAYRNRDLFALARRAGLSALWLGVEDLAGELIRKGQSPDLTKALLAELIAHNISPRIMLMHHDAQPLHSSRHLAGLIDQIRFLFEAGAVGMQCTIASPALGSKWANEIFTRGLVYEEVGRQKVGDAQFDGNHVVACTRSDPWRIQLNLLRGYAAFYNPVNFARTLLARHKPFGEKRFLEQVRGITALVQTAWRLKGYLWRLWRGPIRRANGWPARFRRPGSPYLGLIESSSGTPRDEEIIPVDIASARALQPNCWATGK